MVPAGGVPRKWLVLLLVVALFIVALPPLPQAAAADSSLVIAALHVLEQQYVDPVHPIPLLNAAIATLRKVTGQSAAVLPDIPGGISRAEAEAAFAATFARAVQTGKLPETQLAYDATAGMLASLRDSHTSFLDPQQYLETRQQLLGKPGFTGIGVVITGRQDAAGDAWIFIESVIPGSPAEGSGLRRFDRIIQVDGKPLKNVNTRDAAESIRGPAGSTAVLTIQRGDQSLTVSVVRAPIQEHPVKVEVIQPGVVYAKLFGFSRGAGSQLRSALHGVATHETVRSIVLDLRGNPGGLILEAQNVGGIFLPQGTVLATLKERGAPPTRLRAAGAPLFPRTPLVVLTDASSASASEIIAGAFKDYGRATIVGEKTAGALGGSVAFPLPGRAGMSVTVERITTPQGTAVEGIGISPHVPVALTVADMERREDTQLQAALRVIGARRTHQHREAA
jgi:carboxyl-terminal processing protease